jgi:serine protease
VSSTTSSTLVVDGAGLLVCPGVVSLVDVEGGLNSVRVAWVAPENVVAAGVDRFVVEVVGEGRFVEVGVDRASVEVSGLANGVEYGFVVYAVGPFGAGPASEVVFGSPVTGVEGEVAGIIVKFTKPKAVGDSVGSVAVDSGELTVAGEVADDVTLLELDEAVSVDEAEVIAEDLERSGEVEWAEPDQFLFTADTGLVEPVSVPSDAEWAGSQWNLWDTFGVGVGDGSSLMTDAWASSTGEGVTVAVIDTGVTGHPDLDGRLVAGYDFVSNPERLAAVRVDGGPAVPFDGDYVDEARFGALGRDADPSDPGDWRGVAPVRNSSWHGTQIAGVIAAEANNGQGIVGVAPGAAIQPVRALSWRGGLLSDIAASITWASGGDVDGVPVNATPSDVLNLSFAVQAECPGVLQTAIDGAIARGVLVVAAAGNAGSDVAGFAPANCDGVLTVGATTRDGVRAAYSNWGAGVDVSAPGGSSGGGVLTTSNAGATTPATASFGNDEGTSVAAAHVSGVAAVLLGADPSLSVSALFERLTGSAYVRGFADGVCDVNPARTCGEGIVALAQIATVASGDQDHAMSFNGTSQYAGGDNRRREQFPSAGDITVEAWAYPSGNVGNQRVVNRANAFAIVNVGGTWEFEIGDYRPTS